MAESENEIPAEQAQPDAADTNVDNSTEQSLEAGNSASTPAASQTPQRKPSLPERAARIVNRVNKVCNKALKWGLILFGVTAPLPNSPARRTLEGLDAIGVLPAIVSLEGKEVSYKGHAGDGFAENISATKFPDTPLQPAQVQNFVIEPKGTSTPLSIYHGEKPENLSLWEFLWELGKRANLDAAHGEGVANTFSKTLEKMTGHESNVKYLNGMVRGGMIFNGAHHKLLNQEKTVFNSSFIFSSPVLPSDTFKREDTEKMRAWVFWLAGNDGSGIAPDKRQGQEPTMVYHGPRAVCVGTTYDYSRHCGPTFVAESGPTGGKLKPGESRIPGLPWTYSNSVDEKGFQNLIPGWGGTSNASPTAAARFSGLMERYGNYLSEEQIFSVLCYATAETTREQLKFDIKVARDSGRPAEAHATLNFMLDNYHRHTISHFYDDSRYGFGVLNQQAVDRATLICDDLVRHTQAHPESITRPQTIQASLNVGGIAEKDADGLYVYKVRFSEPVLLNNVTIQGVSDKAPDDISIRILNQESYNVTVKIPIGDMDGGFIGSTRGLTTAGAVQEIEIRSSEKLKDGFLLTCHNTLGCKDAVSLIPKMEAESKRDRRVFLNSTPEEFERVAKLEEKLAADLGKAQIVPQEKLSPKKDVSKVKLQPQNAELAQIQEMMMRGGKGESERKGTDIEQQPAYWRRVSVVPPPSNSPPAASR